MQGFFLWSGRRGSNSRQPAWKAGALPTELLPQVIIFKTLSCFGAEDEARTRDNQLGRLELYQLSYFRKSKKQINTYFVGANIL